MEIILIRHTAVDVVPGICYGQSDVPLRPSFAAEARKVRAQLNGMKFDGVYTSPLSRCTRLAEACGYGDATPDNRLMEMNFGRWEMMRYDEIEDPRLTEWYADYINVRPTGGESFMDQRRRFEAFVDDLRAKGLGRVALFTHGGIIMQAMLMAGICTIDNVFARQPGYGYVTGLSM